MTSLEAHLTPQAERSRGFFWHRLRWRAVRRYVPMHQALEIVDVGAGAGLLGEYLAADRPDARYRFIEPIEALERALEDRFGAHANARGLASFRGADIVTMLDVVEHQDDDREFVRSVVDKSDPGTLIVITVPALPWLWSAWDDELGHRRRYTKRSLAAVTEGIGLAPVEVAYLFPEMIPAALVRKHRRKLGDQDAVFPDPPRLVNSALFAVGVATQGVRRFVPCGTSLFAAYRRI